MKVKSFIVASSACLIAWLSASFIHETGAYSYNSAEPTAPVAEEVTTGPRELITVNEAN